MNQVFFMTIWAPSSALRSRFFLSLRQSSCHPQHFLTNAITEKELHSARGALREIHDF